MVSAESVRSELGRWMDMVWGVGVMNGCWVEDKMSVYVVACGIPESEWVGEGGDVDRLKKWAPDGGWGRRFPLVVG